MYYVIEVKFYKDKTKPYLILYNIKTGDTLKTKITNGQDYAERPFQAGSVINVAEFREKNKMKKINGTSETEKIVVKWEVY